MFTGIVTDVGRVREARDAAGGRRLVIETAFDTSGIAIGASIACSGTCLTVVDKGKGWFAADVSAATLACTTLGDWRPGTAVNLERPLKAGDEFGGHIVQGHVDGVGRVVAVEPAGDSRTLTIELPPPLARYVAAKGSVAVDGVSLTVNRVDGPRFTVNIIPHTWSATAVAGLAPGARVNVEVDVLARYVESVLRQGQSIG